MHCRVRSIARIELLEARVLLSSAYVVYGVSDFTLSQPLINYYFTRTPGGPPISIPDGLGGTTFEDFSEPAVLDTGTSGMILDQTSVQDLGIHNEIYNNSSVVFNDIGIGGGQTFTVSEPLYLGLAAENPGVDINNPATYQSVYTQTYGTASSPIRVELNPLTTYDPNGLSDPTNIFGMPFMMGKTVVMDPRPVYSTTKFGEMNTYIYNQGTPFTGSQTDPGIPSTNLHVQLSDANFLPYTSQDPPGAPGPTFAPNPIIGPNPVHQIDPSVPAGNAPPLSVSFGARSATGSFLFDTGAQISFMSQAMAAQLHVHYQAGTFGTANPVLVDDNGNKLPNQQPVQIGGAGGAPVTASEFYLDSMSLQTTEGTPITFTQVPILVLDVGIQDPNTGRTMVLDGDFGANMMFGSDSTGTNAAFNWVTFDQPDGLLGFSTAGPVGQSAGVVGRYTFYNGSFFDGNDPGANAADDNAIALDKRALTLGDGLASQANYTSFTGGIDGIMIDVANLPASTNLSASDFTFMEGNSNTPNSWAAAPAPAQVIVRPGAGLGGTSRIELTWANGSIRNQWLQITLKSDANTALPFNDVFYFGNLVGSSPQPAANGVFAVSSADMSAVLVDPPTFPTPVTVTDNVDFNRDGRVDGLDQLIARMDSGGSIIDFNSPRPPSNTPFARAGSSPALVLTPAFHAPTTAPTISTSRPRRMAARRPRVQLRHVTDQWNARRHILLLEWRSHFRHFSREIIRPAARRR